jgi:prepilin-type N-terminal cleavage/methylation domain-containing protein
MRPLKNKSGARGFSLMELLTVMAIISILALILFPAMMSYLPDQRVKSDAKRMESFMQKARLKAATLQKPIRVVLNCAMSDRPCQLEMQTAIYSGSTVSGWNTDGAERYAFNSHVLARIDPRITNNPQGGVTPTNVYWAIYMPDSRVYSAPRPFNVFIYYKDMPTPIKGYLLTVSNDSGRVLSKRDQITTPLP